jgi:hypothetical protein
MNTGHGVVTFPGYNSESPWYFIEINTQGKWSLMPVNCSSGSGQPQLKPGESLDFPVIVPDGTGLWRVGLAYDEEVPSNRVTRIGDRALRFPGLRPRAKSKSFAVSSDEVSR